VGLTTLPCKKKIVEKPPRNSAGFCGGGQGLSWAVKPRKEEEEEEEEERRTLILSSSKPSAKSLNTREEREQSNSSHIFVQASSKMLSTPRPHNIKPLNRCDLCYIPLENKF
jgi:hypothetical protein